MLDSDPKQFRITVTKVVGYLLLLVFAWINIYATQDVLDGMHVIKTKPEPVCTHQPFDGEMAEIRAYFSNIKMLNEALGDEVAELKESVKNLEEIQSKSFMERVKEAFEEGFKQEPKKVDDKPSSRQATGKERDMLNRLFEDVEKQQQKDK